MYTEKHVLPCGCGYPFCHIVIMSNHMEKNVIYRIFYGDCQLPTAESVGLWENR